MPAAETPRQTSHSMSGDAAEVQPAWGSAQRIGFRFIFSYIVLFIFPFPFGAFPGSPMPFQAYQKMWRVIVPWVGESEACCCCFDARPRSARC